MRFRLFSALALAALAACGAASARAASFQAQQEKHEKQEKQDEEVEEAFTQTRGFGFGTRPATGTPGRATEPKAATAAKPKPASTAKPGGAGKGSKGGKGSGTTARNKPNGGRPAAGDVKTAATEGGEAVKKPADAGTEPAASGAEPAASGAGSAPAASAEGNGLGLGYTLFMNDPNGNPVVVDSAKEFRAGDKIRVMLEPNVGGYLYIFHAENDRRPQMLYPNVALDNAANGIEAHAREFVPADLKDSFVFDDKPAIERLYIVLSRNPLEGVPAGPQLVEYCGQRTQDCYWMPSAAAWEQIKTYSGTRTTESRNKTPTKIPLAKNSLSRGLKVKREDPPPAVIRMNASSAEDVLVTTVDLVHK